jgi:hypothetical protein
MLEEGAEKSSGVINEVGAGSSRIGAKGEEKDDQEQYEGDGELDPRREQGLDRKVEQQRRTACQRCELGESQG